MLTTHIATVHLLIATESSDDACDIVTDILTGTPNEALLDWAYLPTADGKTFTYPVPGPLIDPATYTEGSFLP